MLRFKVLMLIALIGCGEDDDGLIDNDGDASPRNLIATTIIPMSIPMPTRSAMGRQ